MAKSVYDIIKKQNGEGFARVLRDKNLLDIPDIAHIVKYAGHTAADAEQIFPYLWSLKEFDEDNTPTNTDPFQLLDQAGYHAFEVHNLKEQNSIQHFFRGNEQLCTFHDVNRYRNNYMIHAVKHNVWRDPYAIKPSKHPTRQDEYGTSVISIQIHKNGGFISIKNRYNHSVDHPDQTFNSNPDEIIPGLSAALKAYFNVDWKSTNVTVPSGFILYNNQILKINFEINNCYFGDGFYTKGGQIIDIDKNNQVQLDYFIWDNQQRELLDPAQSNDYFIDIFRQLSQDKKVTISGKHPNQTIEIDGVKIIELENNQIVTLNLSNVITIGRSFLYNNQNLRAISLPNVKTIDSDFLRNNQNLDEISLPNVTTIGASFLYKNENLRAISLPNVKTIDSDFLRNNQNLDEISLPNVITIGRHFLSNNEKLTKISLPNVTTIGDSFLYKNENLRAISLPNVINIDSEFLHNNQNLDEISLPNVITIGRHFLSNNEKLTKISLPNVTKIGQQFLFCDHNLDEISLPNLITVSDFFLSQNQNLTEISLPSVTTIGHNFLSSNEKVKTIDLPEITELPDTFIRDNNRAVVNAPKLQSIKQLFQSRPVPPAINTPISDIFPERRSIVQRFKHAIKGIYNNIQMTYHTHDERDT